MPETKKLRRNAPCHCGSGKKYKQCHLAQDEAERVANLNRQAEIAHLQAHNDDYVPPDPSEADPRERRKKGKTTLMGSFWVLLFLAAAMVLFLMVLNPGSQGTPDLPAAERSAPAGTPQPPGPAPEGKVWSPEHGHWHDAPAVEQRPPAEGTPQPPGPAPEGKVWSPEHGHWHDAPE